jgi:D-serine deaminase-like pyridoxal phosphate-dependent protein
MASRRSNPTKAASGFLFYPLDKAMAASQRFVDEALAGVRALGLDPRIVSSGGTPNLSQVGELRGMTEPRPATYIFNDRMMIGQGVASLADCALHVFATVVSRAAPERGILDAGSKTLTADIGGGLEGFGLIREYPEARIAGFAEEHGMLDLRRCNDRPPVGTLVRIVPNHVCVVVNMVDRLVLVRGDEIVGDLEVTARGRMS